MPDGARLTAALCLALLAFIVTGQIMPLLPEGTDFGYFTVVNVIIGFLAGWVVMGKRAGRGITSAINNGLTGVVVMVCWGLLVQGCYEMVRQAMRNRFDGPFEALAAVFTIALNYGVTIFTAPIVMTLLAGALIAGMATEYAWRTWR